MPGKAVYISGLVTMTVEDRDALHAEIESLRINLRDYRDKHPCSHEIMCWADEVASKALGRPKK
jgi:hypothetical protein